MDLPPVPCTVGCISTRANDTNLVISRNKRSGWGRRKVDLDQMTYITASEIAALKHKLRDNTMERRPCITEALLASAEGAEVLCCLGDDIIVEVEENCSRLSCDRIG